MFLYLQRKVVNKDKGVAVVALETDIEVSFCLFSFLFAIVCCGVIEHNYIYISSLILYYHYYSDDIVLIILLQSEDFISVSEESDWWTSVRQPGDINHHYLSRNYPTKTSAFVFL